MAHGFRPVNRDQQFLLAPDVRQWLPQGHLAWLVLEVVDEFDLSAIVAGYRLGGVGRQAYHPAMLTALLLYGYAVGCRSSRALERACETDVAFRVITGNERPDHATIARFRADHEQALAGLHGQLLGVCVRAGLVDARLVAVDSTRVAANASRRANLTRQQLEEAARQAFREAAAVDAAEDEAFGVDRRGDEPAQGFEPGEGRRERIREALRALDEQPEGRDDIAARQTARTAAGGKPRGRPPLPPDPAQPHRVANGTGKPTRRANLVDPDSRLLKIRGGWVQGYACQAVVTAAQIVLAARATNDHNDSNALAPMVAAARQALADAGADPDLLRVVVADNGYYNHDHIDTVENDLDVIPLVATGKDRDLRHDPDPAASTPPSPSPSAPSDKAPPSPSRSATRPPAQAAGSSQDTAETPSTLTRMARRLEHPTARRIYQRRSVMVEPVFGQTKTNRGLGHFLRRGLTAVNSEWALEMMAHNLTKLHHTATSPAPG